MIKSIAILLLALSLASAETLRGLKKNGNATPKNGERCVWKEVTFEIQPGTVAIPAGFCYKTGLTAPFETYGNIAGWQPIVGAIRGRFGHKDIRVSTSRSESGTFCLNGQGVWGTKPCHWKYEWNVSVAEKGHGAIATVVVTQTEDGKKPITKSFTVDIGS